MGDHMKILIIVAIISLMAAAGNCVATKEMKYPEDRSKELLFRRISNILLQDGLFGAHGNSNSDNNLGCGGSCNGDETCCENQLCKGYSIFNAGTCLWCPSKPGETCGLLDRCCRGYYCTDLISGECKASAA